MADASRNAVMKVETAKKLIRHLAMSGYDSFMLYLEDTYIVKDYPYFGYLRNPYKKEEKYLLSGYSNNKNNCPTELTQLQKTGFSFWEQNISNFSESKQIVFDEIQKKLEEKKNKWAA